MKHPCMHLGLCAGFSLALMPHTAPAQRLFSAGPYTQNFDSLGTVSNAWTDDSTLPSWYASKTKQGGIVLGYRADAGAANAGALYSYGAASAADRALGSLGSGTPGNLAYGIRFKNDTGLAVTNLAFTCTGEQWRNGGSGNPNTLAFSYRISYNAITTSDAANAFSWTAFPLLSFVSPVSGSPAGALDGNAEANRRHFDSVLLTNVVVFPDQEIFFRWYDADDPGTDDGLAIDDLTITFTTTPAVTNPPSITTQPLSRTNNAGTVATFTVVAGGSALSYQWLKDDLPVYDGIKISGASSPTLTISNALAIDAGNYSVVIDNGLASLTSSNASLTVIDPAITFNPAHRTNVLGDTASFFVGAAGSPPLSYQWRSNGVDIAGATANSLNVTNMQADYQADYSVVVSGVGPSVTSAPTKAVLLPTPATLLAAWDFNAASGVAVGPPLPSSGLGAAALVGGTTQTYFGGSFSDYAQISGPTNAGWAVTTFPPQGSNNKLAGAQFIATTLGYQDILLTWEQRGSDTGSKYARLQYGTDGLNFRDGPLITVNNSFGFYSADLSAFTGLNNRTNIVLRFVSEFESTALGTTNDNYVGINSAYGPSGNWRFDLVRVFGNTYTGVSRLPLQFQIANGILTLTWTNPALKLGSSTSVNGPFTEVTGASSPYPVALPASGTRFFCLLAP